jgi:hypothetical protein
MNFLDMYCSGKSVALEGPFVWRHGVVAALRDKSIIFFDDAAVKEVFVPISRILDWQFTREKTKKNLRIRDLERDDEVSIYIPQWLAKREKLLEA